MAQHLESLHNSGVEQPLATVPGVEKYGQITLLPELPWVVMSPYPDSASLFRRTAGTSPTITEQKPFEVSRQLNLPRLSSCLVVPDEYHKEYGTDAGSTYYASAVEYDSESGDMRSTGRNTILASGDVYGDDGALVTRTTVHIGYEGGEPTYASVIRLDAAVPMRPPEITLFPGPFPLRRPDQDDAVQFAYRNGDSFVIEQIDPTTGTMHRIDAPSLLGEELYRSLLREGKSGQAQDSDQAFIQPNNGPELPTEKIVYEVPEKYPVLFTSSTVVK